MAQADKPTTSSSIVAGLGEIGRQRAEAIAAVQAECLKRLQEASQHWAECAKTEADLASKLAAKLTSARSVPEIANAYQDWARQRMQMALDDGQRLFADSLKLLQTSARMFSNGGTGGST